MKLRDFRIITNGEIFAIEIWRFFWPFWCQITTINEGGGSTPLNFITIEQARDWIRFETAGSNLGGKWKVVE